MVKDQSFILLCAFFTGVLISFIYDFLRIKRRIVKTGAIMLGVEDILFWLAASLISYVIVFISNDGQVRGFTILGFLLGIFLYYKLISGFIIKIFVGLLKLLIKIIRIIIKLILKILKVISSPFRFVFGVIKIPGAKLFVKIKNEKTKLKHKLHTRHAEKTPLRTKSKAKKKKEKKSKKSKP